MIWPQALLRIRNRRILMYGCFAAAILASAWRLVAVKLVSYSYGVYASDTNASAVLFGCGVALLLWHQPARLPQWTLHPLVAAISLLAIVVIAQLPERVQYTWGVSAAIPFSGVIILQAITYEWRILENPVAHFLGRISYGIYLWGFVAVSVSEWLGHKHMLLFLAVVSFASISCYAVEKPAQSFARKWSKSIQPLRATSIALATRDV